MTVERGYPVDDDGRPYVAITVIVTVCFDPTDEIIQSAITESGGLFSADDVVRAEIESNLESVSYVRHVSIAIKPKREVNT